MKRFLHDPSESAGDLYSPVVVSPISIASRASSIRIINNAQALNDKLENDKYTKYVSEFYRQGLDVCRDDWNFMDIVTVLYAVAEMGQPENYLEIGVRRGRSVCAVAAASPRTDIYAFDLWQVNYANSDNPGPDFVRSELRKFGYSGDIQFFDGDSHITIPHFLKKNPDLNFDLITVDGDHTIDGAWDDLRNVVPRLRIGGVIVFDDTCNPYCPGLDRIWQDLLLADGGLKGYSFNELGTGVSFAVRMKKDIFNDVRKNQFWRF